MLEDLSSDIARIVQSPGDAPIQREVGEVVMAAALARAEQVLPAAWRMTLRTVALRSAGSDVSGISGEPAEQPQVRSIPYCRSCSVSLGVPHNRGVSDRYCRFCSDEEGRLKPRNEVQRLIAGWFESWQGDLSGDEAMRRAGLFMQAMPAWCNN